MRKTINTYGRMKKRSVPWAVETAIDWKDEINKSDRPIDSTLNGPSEKPVDGDAAVSDPEDKENNGKEENPNECKIRERILGLKECTYVDDENCAPLIDNSRIPGLAQNTECRPEEKDESVALVEEVEQQLGKMAVSSCFDEILSLCSIPSILEFTEYLNRLTRIKKVGEASFSEVYCAFSKSSEDRQIILKVIPLDSNQSSNQQEHQIKHELKATRILSKHLSDKANFVRYIDSVLVRGPYPKRLLQCWDQFRNKYGTENERPQADDCRAHYCVLILENGGVDLEHSLFRNWLEIGSVILQVAHSLAIAEKELSFEHRDLHWGNVLVRETKEEFITYRLSGRERQVRTHGIRCTIIDFTLSRLNDPDESTGANNNVIYGSMDDEEIFTGKGDRQFDLYRQMRQISGGRWERFYPETNRLWLDYLIDKLISPESGSCSQPDKNPSQLKQLQLIRKRLLESDIWQLDF